MLLPGQSLRGRLPLLSLAFRHSHLLRQVPPHLHDVRNPSSDGRNYGREFCPVNLAEMTTSMPFLDLLCAAKYNMVRWLYFPSEGRCAEDFFALKIRWLRLGLNLRTQVPGANTLTPRPLEPLYVRLPRQIRLTAFSSFFVIYYIL